MTKKKKNNRIIVESELGIKVEFIHKEDGEDSRLEIRATSQAVIPGTSGLYSLTCPGVVSGYEVERKLQCEKAARSLFEIIMRANPEAFETRRGFTAPPEGASWEDKEKHFQSPIVYDLKADGRLPNFSFVACVVDSEEECSYNFKALNSLAIEKTANLCSYIFTPAYVLDTSN